MVSASRNTSHGSRNTLSAGRNMVSAGRSTSHGSRNMVHAGRNSVFWA